MPLRTEDEGIAVAFDLKQDIHAFELQLLWDTYACELPLLKIRVVGMKGLVAQCISKSIHTVGYGGKPLRHKG